jgi:hypothetical protein
MCINCNCGLDNSGNIIDQKRYDHVLIYGCDIEGCHEPKSK